MIRRGHAFRASLNHPQLSTRFLSDFSCLLFRHHFSACFGSFWTVTLLLKHVPVSVRLPVRGAQLAALRGRRNLLNPGEEQQTLVAGVPLQLGGNRLHPRLIYRKDTGRDEFLICWVCVFVPVNVTISDIQVKRNVSECARLNWWDRDSVYLTAQYICCSAGHGEADCCRFFC